MPQPHAPTLTAALVAATLALATACGSPASEEPPATSESPSEPASVSPTAEPTTAADLSQADLEGQIAGMYEPEKPKEKLSVACEGPLSATEDASRDCTVTTGDQEVGVRALVTDVEADDLGIETTPFLPPETVAGAIAQSLEIQGYDDVEAGCDGDLIGETGEAVVCEVQTPQGDTTVNVDVTSVDGLLINFDFKSA